MGTPDLADLTRRLTTYAPTSLLAIGPRAASLLATYRQEHPDAPLTHLDPRGTFEGAVLLEALSEHGRFDFAVVRGVLERVDADSGAHLLARLRDVHARRFCVALSASGDAHTWQASELIAMGLTHWPSTSVQEADLEIYGFDVGTYKATPDWLNARHWAHPEHWGKFRW